MVMPAELEEWLTNEGHRVVQVKQDFGYDGLSKGEKLTYEVWLFDTETRNGGVAQYFCNWQRDRWNALMGLMPVDRLPTLGQFADEVNLVIGNAEDPYEKVCQSDIDLFGLYWSLQACIVTELRSVVDAHE